MSVVNIKNKTKYILIDSLLDSYNQNMTLYRMFGDLCYQERASFFMETLRRYVESSSLED